jgi:hypothetical protein
LCTYLFSLAQPASDDSMMLIKDHKQCFVWAVHTWSGIIHMHISQVYFTRYMVYAHSRNMCFVCLTSISCPPSCHASVPKVSVTLFRACVNNPFPQRKNLSLRSDFMLKRQN